MQRKRVATDDRLPARILLALSVILLLASTTPLHAGNVELKNGFVIEGTPIKVPGLDSKTVAAAQGLNVPPRSPYWLIDDGIRRYFTHRLNVADHPDAVVQSDDTSRYIIFKLEHVKKRKGRLPAIIGTPRTATPWDEYGRCKVVLDTPKGPEDVILAISLIHPKYLKIESTNLNWDFAIPVNGVPVPLLREIIHSQLDSSNPDECFAVVDFFLQAELPAGAKLELELMAEEFDDLKSKIEEKQAKLLDLYGYKALDELVRLRMVGQHQLTQLVAATTLKEDLPVGVLREAGEIIEEYRQADASIEEAADWLSLLQAQLPKEQAQRVMPLRALLREELNYDTLNRLEPFLAIAADDTLSAEERLALAYSGWVVGAANAKTKIDEAIGLWSARAIVLRYLHPDSDRVDRERALEQLTELDGISIQILTQMIPQLPMPVEPPIVPENGILSLQVPDTIDDTVPARYSVMLPPEYNPSRSYPAIVLFRAEGKTIEQSLELFGGTPQRPGAARRHGYIVIAPEYIAQDQGFYDWGEAAHEITLRSLFDARSRFNIDSDRVFVSGHGMGGDAALDMALAHPDLWAGCVPFLAQFDYVARMYTDNTRKLPLYFVGGEKDRDLLTRNAKMYAKLMQRGHDLIYCEFKGRGFESYAEELPHVFDWMSRHRRERHVEEWEVYTVRDFDDRFGWVKAVGLPAKLSQPVVWNDVRTYPRRLPIRAQYHEAGNIINVALNPAKRTIIYLSPEMVDFERVLHVRVKGTSKYRDYPRPSIEHMLEELRSRGDRQLLYWARLTL